MPKKLKLKQLINLWKKTNDIEKDVHTCICGDEGEGKTTLMIQTIAQFLKKKERLDMFKNNIIYTKNIKEFYRKYENMKPGGIMGFDEALDFLDRNLWAKAETKELVSVMRGKARKEKCGVFLYNAQLFRDIHGYWRNHRIRYWIELPTRQWFDNTNIAFVSRKGRLPFITGRRDTWLLDTTERLWMEKLEKSGHLKGKEFISMMRKYPFYMGELQFDPMTEQVRDEYFNARADAVKQWGSIEEEDKYAGIKEQRDNAIREAYENGSSIKALSIKTGLVTRSIYTILKGEN